MIPISSLTECLSLDLGGDFRGSHLDDHSTVREAAFGLLQSSIAKKFNNSSRTTKEQDSAALTKFLACNNACREYTVRLNTSGDEMLFGTFKQELYNFFYPHGMPLLTSFDQLFDAGQNGPGAAVMANHGSAYAKLWASPLSHSRPCLAHHYAQRVEQYPLWLSAEVFRQSSLGPARYVDSSRLSFVPKNDTTSRVICTEPVLNMFYQLGIGNVLRQRLSKVFGINLETQAEVNRDLAKAGSKDGSISTIDLESASDTISLNLLKDCIPRDQLAWFQTTRSTHTLIRGKRHELFMVSSMGNGFTFPLQTAIFACAVSAVYKSLGIFRRISVFGDDIICLAGAYSRLTYFLSLLGFRVNVDKSFNEGPFRESCGRDYFKGRNVRGVFVKALSNSAEIHVAVNRLIDWAVEWKKPLWHSLGLLIGHLPRYLPVPYDSDVSWGVRVPSSVARARVHRNIHGYYKYSALSWIPRRVSIHAGKVPGSGRRIIYNPDGLVLSAVYGETVASFLTSRDVGRWKTKRRGSPYWDSPYESSADNSWRTELTTALFTERYCEIA